MKEETDVNNLTSGGRILSQLQQQGRARIDRLGAWFNRLPVRAKQVCVISFGMTISMACVVLIVHAIQGKITESITIDEITLPNDIYMNNHDTTRSLTPVGKLKGEINGEFEAFYVAVDGEGQVFINRNPSYDASRFTMSKDWQQITRDQLETYRKELHFTPHKRGGLKR
jgi:hypothetical protein